MKRQLLPAAGLLLVIAIWEVIAQLSARTAILFPPPSILVRSASTLLATGQWWKAVASSLEHYVLGVAVGGIAGFVCGVICAEHRMVYHFCSGVIRLLRPIPPLAWVPLSVLWFGVTGAAAVFIIAVGVFWVVFDGAYAGISSVDPKYTELAASFSRNGTIQRLREILIPAALPTLLASARSGLGLGWMLLVAAEIVGVPGIGQRMWEGAGLLATDEVMVCMLTIALSYAAVDTIVRSVERKFIWWAYE